MILGLGIDVVEIRRFAEGLQRHGDRFRRRFFTASEQAYCEDCSDAAARYAARFAAKEAFAKALGSGIAGGLQWIDVEVTRDAAGRPGLLLHGTAAARAAERGVRVVHLSITHARETAAAVVVLEA